MKKIIGFFTNRIVISIIGLIALSIIIWFVGPSIKFGDNNTAPLAGETSRLIAIIILLVLWGLNNLRIQLTARKSNKELVADLEVNQSIQNDSVNTDQFGKDYQLLNQRFTDALSTLSNLKFKGKSRSRALYELPWYIIIGPPGSGKTTALVNSSLEFPLAKQFGKASLQGVGGTRNCDWWFTNDAVLIDTAGRYTTQDSHRVADSGAWEAFLSLLKKNRRRRPVNGVLVAISIQDLLFQSEQEREQHAKIIRSRIDELMQKLEVRFPVYLMFTKSDLISGFSEFFEDLSKEDREQVWGISLPNAADSSQSPDFDYLQQELDHLIKQLYARELARVHQERDVKRRALIQGFPGQLDNAKTIISGFVEQTFIKNRYERQPYLRGVYFTSGTQDGTPIDRMMSAVSANFGFDQQLHAQQTQGKSFFLGNLFRDIIFPEAELVGLNRKYETLLKWSRRTGYLSLVVVAAVLLSMWVNSLNRHNEFLSEVDSYIDEFKQQSSTLENQNQGIVPLIPALNALARASIVYDREKHPWLTGFGLYDANVDHVANNAYHNQLRETLLPRLVRYIEVTVAKGHEGGDLYHNFRTYMMLNKVEQLDRDMVLEWFKEDWKKTMSGQASQRQALEAHLQNLLNLELESYPLNDRLVKQTRALLLLVPVQQRIYSRIRNQAEIRQGINLLNLFGESVRTSFTMNDAVEDSLLIPYMFTKEGYDSLDFTPDSPLISDIVNERWLLSDSDKQKVDFIEDDLEEISTKVEALYFAEFITLWAAILKSLDVVDFQSLNQAAEVLSRFVDPVYSPLQSILQITSENTRLSTQILQALGDSQSDESSAKVSALLTDQVKGTRVDQYFKPVNDLLRETKKSPAPLSDIVEKVSQLKEFVGEINLSPDPSRKAFEVALARYKQGSTNAIVNLKKFSGNRPDPVKRWLSKLSDQSWKVILASARQHINSEWKNQVYGFYNQALAGRYPLSGKSRSELALLDFSDFFKPDGKMDGFYKTYINPFIRSSKDWKNKFVDRRSLGLSNKSLAQIKTAQMIKAVYFRQNPEIPGISFQLKPYRLNKNDARFWLDVGEQRFSYSHGPKFWKDLNWSAEEGSNRVRLVFEDLDGNRHEASYEGPWAWLRLQDASKISKTQQSSTYLVEYASQASDASHVMKYLIKARSINNPFRNNLLGSFRCPENL
jgi:type VI secretion system protein ImpL